MTPHNSYEFAAIGDSYQIEQSVYPEGANQGVKYIITDEVSQDCLTLTEDGFVTITSAPLELGYVMNVDVISVVKEDVYTTMQFTLFDETMPESIELTGESANSPIDLTEVGETFQITHEVLPSTAIQEVTYFIGGGEGNKEFISVSDTGLVTLLKKGGGRISVFLNSVVTSSYANSYISFDTGDEE